MIRVAVLTGLVVWVAAILVGSAWLWTRSLL